MKMNWFKKHKTINFDEDAGRQVLEYARGNPTTEQSVEGSLELRRNVHAIIAALPGDTKEHITRDTYLDIASILILQRAEGYSQGHMDGELAAYQNQAPEETVVYSDVDTDTEETIEE